MSARLQLPEESARDYLGCLRLLVFAAFPNCPPVVTDAVLTAHFRAVIRDDHLRRKLIKKPDLTSDQLLSLVQDYEDHYGPSLTTPCFAASLVQRKETRSVVTQTYRNFTHPSRGIQAPVAEV
ncbi:unnamed protein product [Dibothriocephalus latus]|uniref:Uncharacterized protein n=1 Tax=Dibothriocephalus latus TaxID=60516 RepID=A0A3P7PF65_DIBLA|nr:unnamed protein product [Dibothriocephalus latus]